MHFIYAAFIIEGELYPIFGDDFAVIITFWTLIAYLFAVADNCIMLLYYLIYWAIYNDYTVILNIIQYYNIIIT